MDLIVATGLVILLKLDSNRQFFSWCDLEIWWMTSTNYRAPLLHYIKFCASSQTPQWIQTGVIVQKHSIGEFKLELQSGNAQFRSKLPIFCPVWPWNLMDDLEQGKSEGFESCNRPIVRKRPIWVKIGDVLYRVTLKFDGWPWKTKGHLSFAVSSFVQHFIAIGEFKLELQSGNAQFGSNSTIFRAVWPWNLMYDLEKQ